MEQIDWSNNLETGNFEIDSQHKIFVGIINKISIKVVGIELTLIIENALSIIRFGKKRGV